MEALQNGFRGILKLKVAVLIVVAFLIASLLIRFRIREPVARRWAFSKNTHRYCKIMAKHLNIRTTLKGQPVQGTNFLYVGNHMGFVDIFALASSMPGLFITSHEMRETPVLGTLCEMAGCLFVERRSRTKIMTELDTLKQALEQGFNVILYPEATSTNGEAVLPFKKTLMMAGPRAGRPIQTGCVNFLKINDEDFNYINRDTVCWYGNMTFVEALWNTLKAKSISVEIEFLEPIYEGPQADRSQLALKTHAMISSRYQPPRRETEASDKNLATAE